MVNFIQFENIIDMKQARKYLTEWRIETLKRAIARNPGSVHNEAREEAIKQLEIKLTDDSKDE